MKRNALIVLLLLMSLLCCTPAFAESDAAAASPSDAQELEEGLAYFTRVAAVPANVDIPSFYQQVANVSGMYIFTLPDGTTYKRIYGAVGGVYGWYEPVGAKNYIYKNALPIDLAADVELYRAALSQAELAAMERQDYAGILPPEVGVTRVDEVRGVSVRELTFYCAAGVGALCLLIAVGAAIVRAGYRRRQRTRDWR